MKQDKHYTVTVEGCEPKRATREQAIIDLWTGHFTGSSTRISTARDPGVVTRSDSLRSQDFHDVPQETKTIVLDNLRNFHLERTASTIHDLIGERPFKLWDKENKVHYLSCGPVEFYCEVIFGLGRTVAKYTVGVVTTDDFDVKLKDSHAHIEAIIQMVGLIAQWKAFEKIKVLKWATGVVAGTEVA